MERLLLAFAVAKMNDRDEGAKPTVGFGPKLRVVYRNSESCTPTTK